MKSFYSFFLIFFLVTHLLGESNEPSVFEDEIGNEESFFPLPEHLQPKKAPVVKTPVVKAKSIFLSYENTPKRVYVNEIFKVDIKAIVAFENIKDISYSLMAGDEYEILNPKTSFKPLNENKYLLTLYFKLKSPSSIFPNIKITATDNSGYKESSILDTFNPKISTIKKSADFCGVLADSLKVLNYKTTRFDEKSYMFVMKISSKKGNLEDFHIGWVNRDKIEETQGDFLNKSIVYIAFIPQDTKQFHFKYFNLAKRQFESFSFNVVLEKEELSTQIDLNPKASRFDIYKDAFLGFIAFIFLVMFVLKRKKGYSYIYLVVAVVITAYIIYDQLPFSDVNIKKNTQIKILPTENSTVFFTTDRDLSVKVLNKRKEYLKVLLPNNKIGWVKNEDVF